MLKIRLSDPDGLGRLVLIALALFAAGVFAGSSMSQDACLRAYERGRSEGDYEGYWRAQAERGVY